VDRFRNLDPRATMAITGGIIGLVLVAMILSARPTGVVGDFEPGLGSFVPGASMPTPAVDPMGPDGLFAAYRDLGRVFVAGGPATLSVSRADDLVLPSGRLIAADAFYLDSPPFLTPLSPGRLPVMLLEVSMPGSGRSVAAAMVRDGRSEPVTWKPAQVAGGSGIDPGKPFTYGVDSGTGSFAGAEISGLLTRLTESQVEAVFDRIQKGLQATEVATTVTLDPITGANVVVFASGFGDGAYASWFGFDAAGRPVALLTSFDLVESSR
jgi:hypothetical protein